MPPTASTLQFAHVFSKLSRGAAAGRPRCQFLFTLPFALLSGGAYGVQLATRSDLPLAAAVIVCAVALPAFVALQLALEPMAVGLVTGGGSDWDEAVAFLWDSLTGAVVGFPLFSLLGAAPLPSVAGAAGLGAAYGFAAGWVVCGEGPEAFARMLGAGFGRRRAPDYSQADTLAIRGDVAGAEAAYREALETRPDDVAAAVRLARLLSEKVGRHGEAVRILRDTVAAGPPPPAEWAFAVRILLEIQVVRLDDETAAAPDLARLAEAHPEAAEGRWAAARLADIKRRMSGGGMP